MADKLYLLVVIGLDDFSRKEVPTVIEGYRESEVSWLEVLSQLTSKGINIATELAIGDGAFCFWTAVTKNWPMTRHQRCWIHKTANVLNKLPTFVQPRMKKTPHDIWMAETQQKAHKALGQFKIRYDTRYHKAAECLTKNKVKMLKFYDFPAEH
ncbi:transposase [Candidatus Enterovibrio escicola]|uniref:transposase n=1 Tax=Candidatus Enterovibrio escicola TaxID=1927127 RepID=UPI001237B79D|nr:transposase [Candidatus Enterovibrio escacola]